MKKLLNPDFVQSAYSVLVENGLDPKKFNVYPNEIDIYKYRITYKSLLEMGIDNDKIREMYSRIPSIKKQIPKVKTASTIELKNTSKRVSRIRAKVNYANLDKVIDLSKMDKFYSYVDDKESQLAFYKKHNSPKRVLKLAEMNNKTFGDTMQSIVRDFFNLSKPKNKTHDMYLLDEKIEHKSSKFWVSTQKWKWQHIMVGLEYEYLILSGLNFTGINSFIISKSKFLDLKEIGIVKQQGSGEGQGLWVDYEDISTYLTPINTIDDIINYISKN